MASKEELREWLNNDSNKPLIAHGSNHGMQVFIKVPKDEEFTYLYRQYSYDNDEPLKSKDDFESSGIYSKLEGKIYFAHGYFEDIDPNIEVCPNILPIQNNITEGVRKQVELYLDNNMENLSRKELSAKSIEKLSWYKKEGCYNEAKKYFLGNKKSRDVKFKCCYVCDIGFDDLQLLSYIRNPTEFIHQQAQNFLETEQDLMLYHFKCDELLKAFLEEIENQEDTPMHRLRNIIQIMQSHSAKTVKVTVDKGGIKLTFKISAESLRRSSSSYYSLWAMPAKDRRAFEETFGSGTRLYPEDIVEISYCGKSIYSAEPYEDPVETEEVTQTM